MFFSESGFAELGCVFKTNFSDTGEMTWVVTKYEPPSLIQYTIFKPASHIWNLEIALESLDGGRTQLTWNQTYTGLSASGNRYIAGYTEERHRAHLSGLESALVHFTETGEMLSRMGDE
jgi:hypothetical protein